MREGQGQLQLAVLGMVMLGTLWNSYLLLNTQREVAGTQSDAELAAAHAKEMQHMGSQLEQEIQDEMSKQTKAFSRDGQGNTEQILSSIRTLSESFRSRIDAVEASVAKAKPCSCEFAEQTLREVQGAVLDLGTSLSALAAKVDTVYLVTIGRDNAEGLRSDYQRHAFATAASPRSDGENDDGALPPIDTELLILLPTFVRRSLDDNTEYLRKALTSLARQYTGVLAERGVTVLVVNNSPKDHKGVDVAIEHVLASVPGTTLRVMMTDGSEEFADPYDASLKLKVDLPGRPDLLESWTPSRLHCRHLAETFSRALEVPARYVLLWEDDMLMCGDASNGTLAAVFEAIDTANAVASDWTGLRLGFGGNGLVFHESDLPALSDYLLANMHRKPPDWLMTEWYKGLTYTAKMAIGERHRGFTHQKNLFEHIGNHSSFPGRENQGSKDSASHVNYDIPGCFDNNWWLLPAERFDQSCTGHPTKLSPCQ